MENKQELLQLLEKLYDLKRRLKMGEIDRDSLYSHPDVVKYEKLFNAKARLIAKKYNMSPRLFSAKRFF